MKNFIYPVLLILCSVCYAQKNDSIINKTKTPITEFCDISFGMSKNEVLSKVKYKVSKQDSKGLFYNNVIFNEIEYDMCFFNFNDNKFYQSACEKFVGNDYSTFLNIKEKTENIYGFGNENLDFGDGTPYEISFVFWEDENDHSILLVTCYNEELKGNVVMLIYTIQRTLSKT